LHKNILLIRPKRGHSQASYRHIRVIKVLPFIILSDDVAKMTLLKINKFVFDDTFVNLFVKYNGMSFIKILSRILYYSQQSSNLSEIKKMFCLFRWWLYALFCWSSWRQDMVKNTSKYILHNSSILYIITHFMLKHGKAFELRK
jgi:hypothetical protein